MELSKEIIVKEFICEKTRLHVSIRKFDKSKKPMLYMGPREKNGEMRSAGRLSTNDILWLESILPEIKELMK